MFIINLESAALLKSFTASVPGKIVHFKDLAGLKKVMTPEQALTVHNNNTDASDALSPDSAPAKIYSELLKLMTDNREEYDMKPEQKKPAQRKGSPSKAKAAKESRPKASKGKKSEGRGRPSSFEGKSINKTKKEFNPREGTERGKSWNLIKNGMKVETYLEKKGRMSDLAVFVKYGFAKVS